MEIYILPKFMPISFYKRVSRFLRCCKTPAIPMRKILSAYWNATLSCRLMPSNYATLYLVPISFWMLHSLDFFLGTQEAQFQGHVRESDWRASRFVGFQTKTGKSGAFLFLPRSHKNAVAQLLGLSRIVQMAVICKAR